MFWPAILLFVATASFEPETRTDPLREEWQVSSQRRSGLIWNAEGAAGRALVIALHGGTRSAEDVASLTQWPQTAEQHDFVLIAPDGVNRQWNDGRSLTASGEVSMADDVAFLDAVIQAAVEDLGVDHRRVYVTGVSNGGLMSFRYACERPGRVAAIAPSLAKLPLAVAGDCGSTTLPSLLLIAGTQDQAMAFDGEPAPAFRAGLGSNVLMSVPATLRFWRDRLGCAPTEMVDRLPDVTADDRSRAIHLRFESCPEDRAVEALILEGGGHREPTIARCGGRLSPALRWLGAQNCDVETAEFAWRFFSGR